MTIPDLGQHASEDLPTKVFFVLECERPPRDDPDLRVDPSTNPRENFSPASQYAAIPLQFRSTIAANVSKGSRRCHLRDSFQLSKNRLAHPSRRYPPQVIERLLEQVSRLKPLGGGEPLLQRPAPRKGEILPPGELRVPLPPDERFVLSGEPVVFGPAHLVEGLSEVPVFSHAEILPDISRGENTITSKSINTLRR